jgi:hypothetical protein
MIPKAHTIRFGATLLAALAVSVYLPYACWAVSPVKLTGALEGRVSDESGRPQMGAAVQLFNHQEKLVGRVYTDDEGFFAFPGLLPNIYSVRVTLRTYLPAFRNQIQIVAGKGSLLDVSLSGLFSSIHLLPPSSRNGDLMNDDWKWVLRSSSVTRPVFRFQHGDDLGVAKTMEHRPAPVFTDARGLVRFSAGELAGAGPVGQMGTAFAVAASVLGANQVQFAGNVGYGPSTTAPSASFRTSYSRDFAGASPEVSLTFRQLYVPRFSSSGFLPGSAPENDRPPMRTMSIEMSDHTELWDGLDLSYGFEMDSVSFVEPVHYFSPWARLTYSAGNNGRLDVTYTSGNARPELGLDRMGENYDLQRDVVSLNSVPRVTLNDSRQKVQRAENYEIAYTQRVGSREYRVSGYRESVQNAALLVSGAPGDSFSGNLVPDLYTESEVFDAGNYHTAGYTASVTQNLADNYQLTVAYGSVGVLAPRSSQLMTDSPEELRGLIHSGRRQAVSTRASGTIPFAGTHFIASYQFMDNNAATAGHTYSTDLGQPCAGLNIAVRQPIPAFWGLPFRLEATADMRNLLAEGYLPITLSDGRQILLVHTPRSLRGGVNFRF